MRWLWSFIRNSWPVVSSWCLRPCVWTGHALSLGCKLVWLLYLCLWLGLVWHVNGWALNKVVALKEYEWKQTWFFLNGEDYTSVFSVSRFVLMFHVMHTFWLQVLIVLIVLRFNSSSVISVLSSADRAFLKYACPLWTCLFNLCSLWSFNVH